MIPIPILANWQKGIFMCVKNNWIRANNGKGFAARLWRRGVLLGLRIDPLNHFCISMPRQGRSSGRGTRDLGASSNHFIQPILSVPQRISRFIFLFRIKMAELKKKLLPLG